ncbi:hypothetical protein B0A49_06023 [Cryomyces minteri]|uniref:SGNH hydrolase-type esterase domain-containing protein n=1 Tax=Cryomyces minteri TaxID=331657 RepID=A0A4U0X7J1_9PEZI|nr:hypothetical protein B0A49_06023 [Cryomyces minteri]
MASPLTSRRQPISPSTLPPIVLFGDSLTEWSFNASTRGFGWALQRYYGGRATVWNRGIAGYEWKSYNTALLALAFPVLLSDLQTAPSPPPLFITIFVGANDACLIPASAHVPLPAFEAHIRDWVDTVLTDPVFKGTKVILITPPPINLSAPRQDDVDIGFVRRTAREEGQGEREGMRFRTYASKRDYAGKVMEIARSYEEVSDRVVGLDFWRALVDQELVRQGKALEKDEQGGTVYDEDALPGCGLRGAKEFTPGTFVDALHLGPLGYDVLTKELLALLTSRWPELSNEDHDKREEAEAEAAMHGARQESEGRADLVHQVGGSEA